MEALANMLYAREMQESARRAGGRHRKHGWLARRQSKPGNQRVSSGPLRRKDVDMEASFGLEMGFWGAQRERAAAPARGAARRSVRAARDMETAGLEMYDGLLKKKSALAGEEVLRAEGRRKGILFSGAGA